MSLILRSILRDPRPISRALRRFDDDFFLEEWPLRKVRRTLPAYESPVSLMEDMSRHMANTVNRMQDLVEEMETLDEIATRLDDNRPRRKREDFAVVRRTENGGLQLALDVADYKPEDLQIKLVDDNLVIEAQSESSGKDSYKRSHFKRWFKVPDDCKLEEIRSKVTDDNQLLIDLPLNKPIKSNERSIPIEVEKNQAIENNGGHENANASPPSNEK